MKLSSEFILAAKEALEPLGDKAREELLQNTGFIQDLTSEIDAFSRRTSTNDDFKLPDHFGEYFFSQQMIAEIAPIASKRALPATNRISTSRAKTSEAMDNLARRTLEFKRSGKPLLDY